MSIVAKKIMMGSGAVALPSDSEFNRVSFLSHFDGTNNGVNNVFDDGSSSNHTITANGNVTQGSFGPYGTNWSVDFDGGDYFTVPQHADFNVDDGSYTMECFVNTTFSGYQNIIACWDGATSGNPGWGMFISSGNQFGMFVGTAEVGKAGAVVNDGAWHHLAGVFTNSGATITLYVDGAQISTGSVTAPADNAASIIRIGAAGNASATSLYTGKISNLRLVKGTAVYSGSSFTVPTSALTAITNTKLLVLGRNNFSDGSASGHVLTPISDPAVTSFGPFLTSEIYSAATNGASAYFDGDGDSLVLADSSDFELGSGDFTIAMWVYPDDLTPPSRAYNNIALMMHSTYYGTAVGWSMFWQTASPVTNCFRFMVNGTSRIYDAEGFFGRQWTYLTAVRTGDTLKLFINGVEKVSTSFADFSNSTTTLTIGASPNWQSDVYKFDGKMCDIFICKGTAVYTSAFTPPTAPLTAITNTKLLLNMADGQAIDSAAQNNLTLYGTAKTSTAQKLFGTASLLLDGNSDLATISSEAGNFGTGNFTIEFSFRLAANVGGTPNSCIAKWETSGNQRSWMVRMDNVSSANKIKFFDSADGSANSSTTFSTSFSSETWYKIAVVNVSGTVSLYVNGTADSTTHSLASGAPYASTGLVSIGANVPSSPDNFFNGNIDEVRLSKCARYTSNYTAPTKAFADKGQ